MRDVREVATGLVAEVLNYLNAGVYLTDRERTIVFWNRRAEQITGHKAADVIGRRCADSVLSHVDKDGRPLCSSELCPLYRAMVTDAETAQPVILYALAASGERIPVSTSVAPIHDEEGNVIGGVEVFRDERAYMGQMDLARGVIRGMLTTDLPSDERISFALEYSPAEIIGGDFYHVARVSQDVVALFVADVAGHGISAALYVALMRSLVQECGHLLADSSAFMAAMNQRLCDRVPQVGLVTALAATFNATEHWMAYSSAGHPPALLQAASGGPVGRLPATGIPLGVEREAQFELVDLRMAPGDRFLAYTDGVTEIKTGRAALLGVDGLAALVQELPPEGRDHRLVELYAALVRRSATPSQDDDLTMLSCMML